MAKDLRELPILNKLLGLPWPSQILQKLFYITNIKDFILTFLPKYHAKPMSNQIVYQLLKHLAIALYPEDITFLNDSKKYTIKEFMETQNLKKKLLPGDLVLTQTPGPIHSSIRKVAHWRYDHLAIIIDDENMLHVAPPNIRMLASNVLLMKKRNPLVLRLNIPNDVKEKIIKDLMKEVGDRYDYARVLGLSGRVFASKMFGLVKKEKQTILDQPKRNICSDLIAYTIMEKSPTFKAFVKKSFKKLDISNYESFSPDDFWRLAEIDETQVAKIHDSPVSDSSEPQQQPEFQMREWIASVANGLLLYRRIKNSIKKDEVKTQMGKFLVIFKYMFIHDLIPYEKEALAKLLPVNIRFVEFVLVLLQIRQYYYDTVIGQPLEMIKKLFPSFFLISSKLIGHKELDLILGTLGELRRAKSEYQKPNNGSQLIDLIKSKGLGGSINAAPKL